MLPRFVGQLLHPNRLSSGTKFAYVRFATRAMKQVDKEQSEDQVAATGTQLAGEIAHLRLLNERLLRTSKVINRAVTAYRESRKLLERSEMRRVNLLTKELHLGDEPASAITPAAEEDGSERG